MQSAGFLLEYIYIYGVWSMKTTEGTAANGFTGKIDIPQLYRLKNRDREKLVLTYLDAFDRYPKLLNVFPDKRKRLLALEATLRYYTAYDMMYGAGFSLDENVHEAVMLVHSDRMKYTFLKHLAAGSYSREYRNVMNRLSAEDRKLRLELFEELDLLESQLDTIPRPHIYADFLGVEKKYQHQGRGRKLMTQVCRYADEVGLPVMLFTNTADDVKFYQSLGFDVIGETSSEKFGFVNTYMLYTNR